MSLSLYRYPRVSLSLYRYSIDLGLRPPAVCTVLGMSIRILGYPRMLEDTLDLGLRPPAVCTVLGMSIRILGT